MVCGQCALLSPISLTQTIKVQNKAQLLSGHSKPVLSKLLEGWHISKKKNNKISLSYCPGNHKLMSTISSCKALQGPIAKAKSCTESAPALGTCTYPVRKLYRADIKLYLLPRYFKQSCPEVPL